MGLRVSVISILSRISTFLYRYRFPYLSKRSTNLRGSCWTVYQPVWKSARPDSGRSTCRADQLPVWPDSGSPVYPADWPSARRLRAHRARRGRRRTSSWWRATRRSSAFPFSRAVRVARARLSKPLPAGSRLPPPGPLSRQRSVPEETSRSVAASNTVHVKHRPVSHRVPPRILQRYILCKLPDRLRHSVSQTRGRSQDECLNFD